MPILTIMLTYLIVVVIRGAEFATPKYASLGYKGSICKSYLRFMGKDFFVVIYSLSIPSPIGRWWISLTIVVFFLEHRLHVKVNIVQNPNQNKLKDCNNFFLFVSPMSYSKADCQGSWQVYEWDQEEMWASTALASIASTLLRLQPPL